MKRLHLYFYHIIIDGLFCSIPILLSFVILSFGAQEKEVGLILSIANVVITLVSLLTLYFTRYFGFTRTVGFILVLYGLGFLGNIFTLSLSSAGFFFILASSGYGLFHNAAFTYIAANTDKASLGSAFGNFTAIGDLGRIPFATLAGFSASISIFNISGWRTICLFYGCGALLYAGYTFLAASIERSDSPLEPPPINTSKACRPVFSVLRSRQCALTVCAGVLDAFGGNQIFVFLPFLLFAKDISPNILGSFTFAFAFGCLLGKTVLGKMIDRFGSQKIFVAAEITMGLLLLFLVFSQKLAVVIGISLLLGIVTKGTVPAVQTLLAESVKEKQACDNLFIVYSFICGIANMIAPMFFGSIAFSFGITWSFGLMAISAVLSIFPIFLMRKHSS